MHIGKSVTDKFIEVQPDLEIGEVVRSLDIYVEYVVQLEDNAEQKKDTEDVGSNVLSMLMQVASDRAHLPEITEERHNKKFGCKMISLST